MPRSAFKSIPLHLLPQTRQLSTGNEEKSSRIHRQKGSESQKETDELQSGVPRNSSGSLTHLSESGAARMVDISNKVESTRAATAIAHLLFSNPKTHQVLTSGAVEKGDAIAVARIAAIQAAKKTSDLIPLAHPALNITSIDVAIEAFSGSEKTFISSFFPSDTEPSGYQRSVGGVTIKATVKCQGKTGIEMEAITAATMGAVTMYDMLKAIDKGMVIMGARVIEKKGGKSGDWVWDEANQKIRRLHEDMPRERPRPLKENDDLPASALFDMNEWNTGLTNEFSISETSADEQIPPKLRKVR